MSDKSKLLKSRSRFGPFLRTTSALLISAFIAQDVVYANPNLADSVNELAYSVQRIADRKNTLNLPEEIGAVEESFDAPYPLSAKRYTLFLIQDAHVNESAQRNIAKIIDHLIEKEKIQTVFLEAGTGDDSLSDLRPLADAKKRLDVSERFLRKGYIQGPDYLDINSDKKFQLWGVEDKVLYYEAVGLYRDLVKNRDAANAFVDRIERALKSLKPRLFSPKLLDFDKKRRAYQENIYSLTDYFKTLSDAAKDDHISLLAYPNFLMLKEVQEKESAIDFQKANEEQQAAISSLPVREQKELREQLKFIGKGLDRAGADNSRKLSDFYTALEQSLRGGVERRRSNLHDPSQHEIASAPAAPRNDFAELTKYFDYLRAVQKIRHESLLNELEDIEEQVYAALITTNEERSLVEITRVREILDRLVNLKATSSDIHHIQQNPEKFTAIEVGGVLNRQFMLLQSHYEDVIFLDPKYDAAFEQAKKFYDLTQKRDEVFVRKILEKLQKENQAKAAFVVGGYHTENLKRILREKNISYVSIMPRVLQETNSKRYEKLLLEGIRSTVHGPQSTASDVQLPKNILKAGSIKKLVNTLPGAEMAVLVNGARLAVRQMLTNELTVGVFNGARLSSNNIGKDALGRKLAGKAVSLISQLPFDWIRFMGVVTSLFFWGLGIDAHKIMLGLQQGRVPSPEGLAVLNFFSPDQLTHYAHFYYKYLPRWYIYHSASFFAMVALVLLPLFYRFSHQKNREDQIKTLNRASQVWFILNLGREVMDSILPGRSFDFMDVSFAAIGILAAQVFVRWQISHNSSGARLADLSGSPRHQGTSRASHKVTTSHGYKFRLSAIRSTLGVGARLAEANYDRGRASTNLSGSGFNPHQITFILKGLLPKLDRRESLTPRQKESVLNLITERLQPSGEWQYYTSALNLIGTIMESLNIPWLPKELILGYLRRPHFAERMELLIGLAALHVKEAEKTQGEQLAASSADGSRLAASDDQGEPGISEVLIDIRPSFWDQLYPSKNALVDLSLLLGRRGYSDLKERIVHFLFKDAESITNYMQRAEFDTPFFERLIHIYLSHNDPEVLKAILSWISGNAYSDDPYLYRLWERWRPGQEFNVHIENTIKQLRSKGQDSQGHRRDYKRYPVHPDETVVVQEQNDPMHVIDQFLLSTRRMFRIVLHTDNSSIGFESWPSDVSKVVIDKAKAIRGAEDTRLWQIQFETSLSRKKYLVVTDRSDQILANPYFTGSKVGARLSLSELGDTPKVKAWPWMTAALALMSMGTALGIYEGYEFFLTLSEFTIDDILVLGTSAAMVMIGASLLGVGTYIALKNHQNNKAPAFINQRYVPDTRDTHGARLAGRGSWFLTPWVLATGLLGWGIISLALIWPEAYQGKRMTIDPVGYDMPSMTASDWEMEGALWRVRLVLESGGSDENTIRVKGNQAYLKAHLLQAYESTVDQAAIDKISFAQKMDEWYSPVLALAKESELDKGLLDEIVGLTTLWKGTSQSPAVSPDIEPIKAKLIKLADQVPAERISRAGDNMPNREDGASLSVRNEQPSSSIRGARLSAHSPVRQKHESVLEARYGKAVAGVIFEIISDAKINIIESRYIPDLPFGRFWDQGTISLQGDEEGFLRGVRRISFSIIPINESQSDDYFIQLFFKIQHLGMQSNIALWNTWQTQESDKFKLDIFQSKIMETYLEQLASLLIINQRQNLHLKADKVHSATQTALKILSNGFKVVQKDHVYSLEISPAPSEHLKKGSILESDYIRLMNTIKPALIITDEGKVAISEDIGLVLAAVDKFFETPGYLVTGKYPSSPIESWQDQFIRDVLSAELSRTDISQDTVRQIFSIMHYGENKAIRLIQDVLGVDEARAQALYPAFWEAINLRSKYRSLIQDYIPVGPERDKIMKLVSRIKPVVEEERHPSNPDRVIKHNKSITQRQLGSAHIIMNTAGAGSERELAIRWLYQILYLEALAEVYTDRRFFPQHITELEALYYFHRKALEHIRDRQAAYGLTDEEVGVFSRYEASYQAGSQRVEEILKRSPAQLAPKLSASAAPTAMPEPEPQPMPQPDPSPEQGAMQGPEQDPETNPETNESAGAPILHPPVVIQWWHLELLREEFSKKFPELKLEDEEATVILNTLFKGNTPGLSTKEHERQIALKFNMSKARARDFYFELLKAVTDLTGRYRLELSRHLSRSPLKLKILGQWKFYDVTIAVGPSDDVQVDYQEDSAGVAQGISRTTLVLQNADDPLAIEKILHTLSQVETVNYILRRDAMDKNQAEKIRRSQSVDLLSKLLVLQRIRHLGLPIDRAAELETAVRDALLDITTSTAPDGFKGLKFGKEFTFYIRRYIASPDNINQWIRSIRTHQSDSLLKDPHSTRDVFYETLGHPAVTENKVREALATAQYYIWLTGAHRLGWIEDKPTHADIRKIRKLQRILAKLGVPDVAAADLSSIQESQKYLAWLELIIYAQDHPDIQKMTHFRLEHEGYEGMLPFNAVRIRFRTSGVIKHSELHLSQLAGFEARNILYVPNRNNSQDDVIYVAGAVGADTASYFIRPSGEIYYVFSDEVQRSADGWTVPAAAMDQDEARDVKDMTFEGQGPPFGPSASTQAGVVTGSRLAHREEKSKVDWRQRLVSAQRESSGVSPELNVIVSDLLIAQLSGVLVNQSHGILLADIGEILIGNEANYIEIRSPADLNSKIAHLPLTLNIKVIAKSGAFPIPDEAHRSKLRRLVNDLANIRPIIDNYHLNATEQEALRVFVANRKFAPHMRTILLESRAKGEVAHIVLEAESVLASSRPRRALSVADKIAELRLQVLDDRIYLRSLKADKKAPRHRVELVFKKIRHRKEEIRRARHEQKIRKKIQGNRRMPTGARLSAVEPSFKPDPQRLAGYYDAVSNWVTEHGEENNWLSFVVQFPHIRRAFVDRIRNQVRLPHGLTTKILSLGSGRGDLEDELKREGFNVTAVDISSENAKSALKKYVYTVQADAHGLEDFPDDYDVVVISEAIQHLEINRLLESVTQRLKNDGKVMISSYVWPGGVPEDLKADPDYNNYTPAEITKALTKHGFRPPASVVLPTDISDPNRPMLVLIEASFIRPIHAFDPQQLEVSELVHRGLQIIKVLAQEGRKTLFGTTRFMRDLRTGFLDALLADESYMGLMRRHDSGGTAYVEKLKTTISFMKGKLTSLQGTAEMENNLIEYANKVLWDYVSLYRQALILTDNKIMSEVRVAYSQFKTDPNKLATLYFITLLSGTSIFAQEGNLKPSQIINVAERLADEGVIDYELFEKLYNKNESNLDERTQSVEQMNYLMVEKAFSSVEDPLRRSLAEEVSGVYHAARRRALLSLPSLRSARVYQMFQESKGWFKKGDQRLLPVNTREAYRRIKERLVQKNDGPIRTARYDYFGADISSAFLMSDADVVYASGILPMRSRMTKSYDTGKMKFIYSVYKSVLGYQQNEVLDAVGEVKIALLWELEAMGVSPDNVKFETNSDGEEVVTFNWSYDGTQENLRLRTLRYRVKDYANFQEASPYANEPVDLEIRKADILRRPATPDTASLVITFRKENAPDGYRIAAQVTSLLVDMDPESLSLVAGGDAYSSLSFAQIYEKAATSMPAASVGARLSSHNGPDYWASFAVKNYPTPGSYPNAVDPLAKGKNQPTAGNADSSVNSGALEVGSRLAPRVANFVALFTALLMGVAQAQTLVKEGEIPVGREVVSYTRTADQAIGVLQGEETVVNLRRNSPEAYTNTQDGNASDVVQTARLKDNEIDRSLDELAEDIGDINQPVVIFVDPKIVEKNVLKFAEAIEKSRTDYRYMKNKRFILAEENKALWDILKDSLHKNAFDSQKPEDMEKVIQAYMYSMDGDFSFEIPAVRFLVHSMEPGEILKSAPRAFALSALGWTTKPHRVRGVMGHFMVSPPDTKTMRDMYLGVYDIEKWRAFGWKIYVSLVDISDYLHRQAQGSRMSERAA